MIIFVTFFLHNGHTVRKFLAFPKPRPLTLPRPLKLILGRLQWILWLKFSVYFFSLALVLLLSSRCQKVIIKKSSNDNFFVQKVEVFTKSTSHLSQFSFLTKTLSFDDFLMTTLEHKN